MEREQTQQLEAQYREELASASKPVQKSSLGSMEDAATRKLLINLIMTMNATFPDYDFRFEDASRPRCCPPRPDAARPPRRPAQRPPRGEFCRRGERGPGHHQH